jgi:hypothetical protein
MSRDGWVYTSDASWANRGNRSGTRYHWPREDDPSLAACGIFMLDSDYGGQPMQFVPDHLRCRRRACQQRFNAPAGPSGEDQTKP